MAKHLPKSQRPDREYLQQQIKDFLYYLAQDDAEEAEISYNETCGVMCAMMERMKGYNVQQEV